MTTSPAGRAFIESWETFRPTAYKPTPKDVPTIAYGHTHDVKMGDTCTLAQADALLGEDLFVCEHVVDNAVTAPLDQNQYDALISFVFNVGAGAFSRSTLRKLLNEDDFEGAAEQFLVWDHQAGIVLPGLLRRRQAERDLFLKEIA